jgi:hypothetical protein
VNGLILLSFVAALLPLMLLPQLFAELMAMSLGKLHLSPEKRRAADHCHHGRRPC